VYDSLYLEVRQPVQCTLYLEAGLAGTEYNNLYTMVRLEKKGAVQLEAGGRAGMDGEVRVHPIPGSMAGGNGVVQLVPEVGCRGTLYLEVGLEPC
jgi:hypothetical protein